MAKTNPKASKTCFVIMPFHRDQSLQEVYEISIKPAVELAGLRCIRADEIPEAGLILKHILEAAYEADVVIADITGSNPNVMYELGLAHAFAKPVIMLSQNIGEAPFDLKTYRIIDYKPTSFGSADKLREAIRSAMEATLSPATAKDRVNPVRQFIPTVLDQAEAVELRQLVARLEEDNKKLEGMRDLAQEIIDKFGAHESLEQIQDEIESSAGERSVAIDLHDEAGSRRRLTFKKIPKSKQVKLPPRKE